jgi:DNA polymerase-3 subunit gamma/tau
MSLYRKYRPQNFGNLVGQDHVSITLSNALKLDRVSHAYLFTGPRGTGKTSTARIMAKSVNCLNLKDGSPCEECEICRDINDGRLIDVIEIDAASNRGIDEMRDLKEKINFAPTRARNKVYIIDEVHMLTKEAFNALLKTLEEPPASVYFILATTEVHKVPETILSRCQRFDFRRIDIATLVARLKFIAAEEKIEAEDKALEMISDHAQGGMRDAIGLMEQISTGGKLTYDNVCTVLGVSGYASIEKLYGFLIEKNTTSALDEIHALYEEGFDLVNFNKNFLEYLRKRMIESVAKNDQGLTIRILELVDLFGQSFEQAKHTPIAQLPLELAVVEAGMEATPMSARADSHGGYSAIVSRPVSQPPVAPVHANAVSQSIPAARAIPDVSIDRTHGGLAGSVSADAAPSAPAHASSMPNESDHVPNVVHTGEQIYSLDDIKGKWMAVIAAVKIPAAKQALNQANPIKIHHHDLTLAFSNNFYLGKVKESANRVEIERAFEQILNVKIKIVPEPGKAEDFAPVQADTTPENNPLTESAMEIFGVK